MCLACVGLFWGLASLRACGGNARFVSVLSDSVPGFLLLRHLALAPRLRCHCKKGEDAEHSRGRVGEKQVRPQDSRPPGVRPHHHNITTERRHHRKKGEDTERKLGKTSPATRQGFKPPALWIWMVFICNQGKLVLSEQEDTEGLSPKHIWNGIYVYVANRLWDSWFKVWSRPDKPESRGHQFKLILSGLGMYIVPM